MMGTKVIDEEKEQTTMAPITPEGPIIDVPIKKTDRKLLVALDQTEQSRFTLDWALRNCVTSQDELILLHVYEVDMAMIPGRISEDQLQQLHQKVGSSYLFVCVFGGG
jgi:hypothetical protein